MKPALPRLVPEGCDDAAAGTDTVLLAVYAPFGTDKTLSSYPGKQPQPLKEHPLVRHLREVAGLGIHVSALIDRVGENTYLVEIPAGEPENMRITSSWKEDMSSPLALAGFLQRAHECHPKAAIVLSLEGHGAGYLPEIDRTQLTVGNVTAGGKITWTISGEDSPILPTGAPVLPTGAPVLPTGSPVLPVNHMPLSSWGTGDALRRAQECGVPEGGAAALQQLFQHVGRAAAHGGAVRRVRHRLHELQLLHRRRDLSGRVPAARRPGSHTTRQLAEWFALGNQRFLEAKGNHPTVGASVQLARMKGIADGIDAVARELLHALRANPLGSAAAKGRRRRHPGGHRECAAVRHQQRRRLWARHARRADRHRQPGPDAAGAERVAERRASAASALSQLLADIKRYGSNDAPWLDTSVRWDFKPNEKHDLAMNILLPDPQRKGIWDWRSPYYMDINPDPNLPLVQPHVIDFLKETNWVEFIDEYHKGVPFAGLRAATIPDFPIFDAKFVPPCKPPGYGGKSDNGKGDAAA